jgi:hypothetical protein
MHRKETEQALSAILIHTYEKESIKINSLFPMELNHNQESLIHKEIAVKRDIRQTFLSQYLHTSGFQYRFE